VEINTWSDISFDVGDVTSSEDYMSYSTSLTETDGQPVDIDELNENFTGYAQKMTMFTQIWAR
jgi:hypothetical protein